MSDVTDLYTEPQADINTLRNLGPLTHMAGSFEGAAGADVHPVSGGDETDAYVERYVLEPIDPQTNGPQLLYGLRYHQHVRKPGDVETFHDQVGYWLWEPETRSVTLTLSIPRAQVLLATGYAESDADQFSLHAARGSTVAGIASGVFLDSNFTTATYSIIVSILGPDSWAYDQRTEMHVAGRPSPAIHTDASTLVRTGHAQPNPLARSRPEEGKD